MRVEGVALGGIVVGAYTGVCGWICVERCLGRFWWGQFALLDAWSDKPVANCWKCPRGTGFAVSELSGVTGINAYVTN